MLRKLGLRPRGIPGILLAVRSLVTRAGAPQGPISPSYQQRKANEMKREKHRSFLLLLFLIAATVEQSGRSDTLAHPELEFRYGDVIAFQFVDGSVRWFPWPMAMFEDSERPRQLRKRVPYSMICRPDRFRSLKDGQESHARIGTLTKTETRGSHPHTGKVIV